MIIQYARCLFDKKLSI
jgi:hypothetical protein